MFRFAGWLVAVFAVSLIGHSAVRGDVESESAKEEAEDAELYRCKEARAEVHVNLKPETSLPDLVEWATTFTCKKFIYNARIKGSAVTLVAPGTFSPREAWNVFLVALQSINLTVVPKGNVLEIVEAPTAKEKPLPVYRPDAVRAIDQLVRIVLRPEHAEVDELAEALGAIKSKDGAVLALAKSGLLLVTDYGTVIDRMLELSREIDQPHERQHIYVLKLQHVDPKAAADELAELLASGAAAAPVRSAANTRSGKALPSPTPAAESAPVKIVADQRARLLLLVSDEIGYRRVRSLLKYIDLPVRGEDDSMYVYHLQHADATALAATLSSSLGGGSSSGKTSSGRKPSPGPAAPALQGVAFEGEVRVTADGESNALVVNASGRDFASLREVIAELDRPRRQVYIEALIVELQVGSSRDLGTTWHAGEARTIDNQTILGIAGVQHPGFGTLNLVQTLKDSGTGGLLSLTGPILPGAEVLLPGVSFPSVSVLVQALATRGQLDVVASPHLTALDNKEAWIKVGRNIPYQANSIGGGFAPSGTDGASNFVAGTSVQRQEVGLTLKLKPFINESNLIRLEIDQEVQDLAPSVNEFGPTWSERQITTSVVVADQQTVVIGGLVQERSQTEHTKVPLLGDIPILGWLFRREHASTEKTNLLVILTPYIIEDPLDMQRVLERRTREQEEFAATMNALDHAKYRPEVDYRRRRGVLEEINRSVQQVERDAAVLEEFREDSRPPDGPIE